MDVDGSKIIMLTNADNVSAGQKYLDISINVTLFWKIRFSFHLNFGFSWFWYHLRAPSKRSRMVPKSSKSEQYKILCKPYSYSKKILYKRYNAVTLVKYQLWKKDNKFAKSTNSSISVSDWGHRCIESDAEWDRGSFSRCQWWWRRNAPFDGTSN